MNAMDAGQTEADFTRALIDAARTRKSWRERLQWIRERLTDPAFAPSSGQLATIAIYLRLLATGEIACEEDGRHFRPNHHAEAALQIESALERLSTPETAWILRRIYPYLPSWGEEFRRSEPLTRIRDIAHRNDIPSELKKEIKHRLQNKLHRCAGPEDLRTSAEILQRITSPGNSYAPAFVQEFHIFHAELQEFFNATDLQKRLRTLEGSSDPALREGVKAFMSVWKEGSARQGKESAFQLALLERLTALRRLCVGRMEHEGPHQRSQLRLVDIGLEGSAFALLSEAVAAVGDLSVGGAWPLFLRLLAAALDNVRLGLIEPEECSALQAEFSAWANDFTIGERFHLLRVLASLARARRLSEGYADRITHLFASRVSEVGGSLGVMEHALKVFSEGDVRGHLVFQLSRLVDLGLQAARTALKLPPWEAIVPGEAVGVLVRAVDLVELEGEASPLVVLLEQTDGEAEIPAGVKGVVLGHSMPHLSHLGVRARQAHVPFAACFAPEHLGDFATLVGKNVHLRVTSEGVFLKEADGTKPATVEPTTARVTVLKVVLTDAFSVLSLDQARPDTCGAKAATAQRLLELAAGSGRLFRAPRGLALPFGVMEQCLAAAPQIQREVQACQERLPKTKTDERDRLLERLRELVRAIPVPEEIEKAVTDYFGPTGRLAVRSSANGEDLEHLAGAGLYESVVNVPPHAVRRAIQQVWSSLWTRRAVLSRQHAGIPHDQIHMAVLLQELVAAELSFIMHTVNPLTGNRDEALVELAVGLGEVLASSSLPGTPYRLACHRSTLNANLLACATFSIALRPSLGGEGPEIRERLDYSRVALSSKAEAARRLGSQLGRIATFLEDHLGAPQDVEGVCVGEEIHLVQTRAQQGL